MAIYILHTLSPINFPPPFFLFPVLLDHFSMLLTYGHLILWNNCNVLKQNLLIHSQISSLTPRFVSPGLFFTSWHWGFVPDSWNKDCSLQGYIQFFETGTACLFLHLRLRLGACSISRSRMGSLLHARVVFSLWNYDCSIFLYRSPCHCLSSHWGLKT